jgi:hypothetical protein
VGVLPSILGTMAECFWDKERKQACCGRCGIKPLLSMHGEVKLYGYHCAELGMMPDQPMRKVGIIVLGTILCILLWMKY